MGIEISCHTCIEMYLWRFNLSNISKVIQGKDCTMINMKATIPVLRESMAISDGKNYNVSAA